MPSDKNDFTVISFNFLILNPHTDVCYQFIDQDFYVNFRKSVKKSDTEVQCNNRILTAGELRRRKELKKKQERKKGYCECCRINYDDLDRVCACVTASVYHSSRNSCIIALAHSLKLVS